MSVRHWRVASAAAGLLAVALAGCGGSSSSVSSQPSASVSGSRQASATPSPATSSASASSASAQSPSPSASGSVGPGHLTPEAAVTGFLTAIYAGDHAAECTYLKPSVQADCAHSTPTASPPTVTGSFVVHNAVIQGDKALVSVTGSECTSGVGCLSNSDPASGMPSGSVSFQQAYNDAVTNGAFSPVPCVKINGKWYM